jgi:hypothetical protein
MIPFSPCATNHRALFLRHYSAVQGLAAHSVGYISLLH